MNIHRHVYLIDKLSFLPEKNVSPQVQNQRIERLYYFMCEGTENNIRKENFSTLLYNFPKHFFQYCIYTVFYRVEIEHS